MSELTVDDGKLVVRNGALGTGQACCCGGGVCCLPDGTCSTEYVTQAQCEECESTSTCQEYVFLENPEDQCPEGFTPDGFGGCSRTTVVASCAECPGYCTTVTSGTCGQWVSQQTCDPYPCCTGACTQDYECTEQCKCDDGACVWECECTSAAAWMPIGSSFSDNCETQPFIEALAANGFSNVAVEVVAIPIGNGFFLYQYRYSGECCGRIVSSPVVLTDGGCQWPDAGQGIFGCDTCENPLP